VGAGQNPKKNKAVGHDNGFALISIAFALQKDVTIRRGKHSAQGSWLQRATTHSRMGVTFGQRLCINTRHFALIPNASPTRPHPLL
jgi:hypothetical protein